MGDTATGGSHAALMDGLYRYQRHVYDLTRKYYLLGRDRLIAGLDVPQGGRLLEVGCGTGRNLAAIGRAYPSAQLHGFDISAEMLRTARHTLDRSGMGERTMLAQGDATAFDPRAMFGVEAFDRVVISYALSMIPDWEAALHEAVRHVRPGGRVDIVDFGGQTGLPSWIAAAQLRWLKMFHVTPRLTLASAARGTGEAVETAALYRDYARLVRITRTGQTTGEKP